MKSRDLVDRHSADNQPGVKKTGVKKTRRPASNGWKFSSHWVAVHWVAAVVLLVVVGFQPIRNHDFWWQLSRGSVVASGSSAPSRTLLTMETQADADWLGGLPIYLLFQTLGGHAVMLTRVFVIAACVLWLLAPRRVPTENGIADKQDRLGPRLQPPLVWWVVIAASIALAESVNSTPQMFDCVAITTLVGLRFRSSIDSSFPRVSRLAVLNTDGGRQIKLAIMALLLFVVWSNLSCGIFAGLIAWLTWDTTTDKPRNTAIWRSSGTHWLLAGCMFLGGMVNPRGVNVWKDSLSSLVPSWLNSASVLADTPWQPLLHDWTNSTTLFFLLLSLIWIGSQTRNLSRIPDGLACFFWLQFLAWSNCQNVAMVSTWMAADVLMDCHANGRWFVLAPTRASRHVATTLAGPVLVVAALPISNLPMTMGWGLDASLDNRLLQISLESTRPHGTALADDTRSGGMMAWEILRRSEETSAQSLSSTNGATGKPFLQLQDVPMRGVIAGRLDQHRRLLDDLCEERLMSFRLTDGSEAGYWVPLENRQTTLLVISQTQTDLLRGLEPSIWKPLSLDSPVIPYAQAGDAAYAKRMIEILSDRETVEYQSWAFEFPSSTGSIFDRDWWGLRFVIASDDQTWRQAEVFRAMGLHYAALRVLSVAANAYPDSTRIRCAILRCQRELADAERIDAGLTSRFRDYAASELPQNQSCSVTAGRSGRTVEWTSLAWDEPLSIAEPGVAQALGKPATSDDEVELRSRVIDYLQHGPAALMVPADFEPRDGQPDSQIMYAGLCGSIEAGNRELADRYLTWFAEHPDDPVLKRLVQIRTEELYPGSANRQNSQP